MSSLFDLEIELFRSSKKVERVIVPPEVLLGFVLYLYSGFKVFFSSDTSSFFFLGLGGEVKLWALPGEVGDLFPETSSSSCSPDLNDEMNENVETSEI